MDPIDLYARASDWTLGHMGAAAADLDAPTLCTGWDVRTLMNHMLETQQYFISAARGAQVTPPGQDPPEVLGDDPVADLRNARRLALQAFAEDGVVESSGPMVGIAFSDQLL